MATLKHTSNAPKVGRTVDVCIVDFCGYSYPGHWPTSFWADWDGSEVIFGGDWDHIPNMPTDTEPTEQEVDAWVAKHKEVSNAE